VNEDARRTRTRELLDYNVIIKSAKLYLNRESQTAALSRPRIIYLICGIGKKDPKIRNCEPSKSRREGARSSWRPTDRPVDFRTSASTKYCNLTAEYAITLFFDINYNYSSLM
jgi:hypothetical protein